MEGLHQLNLLQNSEVEMSDLEFDVENIRRRMDGALESVRGAVSYTHLRAHET